MFASSSVRVLAGSLLLLLLLFGRAAAQNSISGKVLDPAGKPVGHIEVLLHAVQKTAGTQIDKDTTRADGSFRLTAQRLDSSAVYFVAVTWNGSLYIGELLRPPFPQTQDYVVQVGVNPVDFKPAAAGTEAPASQAAPPEESNRTAGILVVAVAGLVIASIIWFAMSRRAPARRRWLLELARLEDELETNPEDGDALQQRRAELRERLRAAQSS